MSTTTSDERISGSCLCGAVRFSATRPVDFGVCHCKQCQRWAGSAFFGVTLPYEGMEIEGGDHVVAFRSSPIATRSHCRTCGSPLWFRDDAIDGGGSGKVADYEVPLGLLDDPDGLRLVKEIFIDRKCDSYALAGDHERETEADYYARKPHVREATR